ncbi:MAG: hypothetical protein ACK5X3_08940, partial [Pseudomonadota bacterium]
ALFRPFQSSSGGHPNRRRSAAGAAGLKRSASHLRITASPTPDAPRPRPAVHTHGLRRPRSTRIGSEGAATDAPANPNTPGTTRQDRDSGAFARAAAESASASTFDRQGRMVIIFPIESFSRWNLT